MPREYSALRRAADQPGQRDRPHRPGLACMPGVGEPQQVVARAAAGLERASVQQRPDVAQGSSSAWYGRPPMVAVPASGVSRPRTTRWWLICRHRSAADEAGHRAGTDVNVIPSSACTGPNCCAVRQSSIPRSWGEHRRSPGVAPHLPGAHLHGAASPAQRLRQTDMDRRAACRSCLMHEPGQAGRCLMFMWAFRRRPPAWLRCPPAPHAAHGPGRDARRAGGHQPGAEDRIPASALQIVVACAAGLEICYMAGNTHPRSLGNRGSHGQRRPADSDPGTAVSEPPAPTERQLGVLYPSSRSPYPLP